MLRKVGGVVAGILVFVAIVSVLEMLAHQLFSMSPEGRIPAGLHVFVAFAYFLASLGGGFVAGRIGREHWAAWVIALLVAAGAAFTLTRFTHPVWMQIASILAPLIGGFIASRLALPRAQVETDATL